jgi:hypothetical protein
VFGRARLTRQDGLTHFFLYDRPGDLGFRNFMRKTLAYVEGLPLVKRPDFPPELAGYPYSDKIPEGSLAHFLIPAGSVLEAGFRVPRREGVVEILAEARSPLRVEFFKGNGGVGSVLLAPDTKRPSLAARYLAVPGATRKTGYDRLRIRPLGKTGSCGLGYVFIYDDAAEKP